MPVPSAPFHGKPAEDPAHRAALPANAVVGNRHAQMTIPSLFRAVAHRPALDAAESRPLPVRGVIDVGANPSAGRDTAASAITVRHD